MKQLLFIFWLAPFLLIGQTKEKNEKLKDLYSKAISNADSLKFQKEYFTAFPDNFKNFNNTFGYFENRDPHLSYAAGLYDESEKHINLFFRLNTINVKDFYKKIIGISIGGHWEADAINYFQKGLREKVFADPRLTFDLLKSKTDKDLMSFWFFFFQSAHPVYKTIPTELEKMKLYDNKTYGLMEKGLEQALKESGH